MAARLGRADDGRALEGTFPAVLVEVAVIQRADVGDETDDQVAGPGALRRRRLGRDVVTDLSAQAGAGADLAA